ncbi:helix-turn-helix domain-containing protein [Ferruginibacter sp.]
MKEQLPGIYLYRRIVQAKLFIDGHYGDKINLDDIADEAFFSKFHFIRLFKMAYGKTPHQYLTAVRIEQAKLMLQNNHPVTHVCFAVGFDSLSSFTGLFKRITGNSPSVYQQLQLQRKRELRAQPLQFIPHCFALKNGWMEKSNFEEVL